MFILLIRFRHHVTRIYYWGIFFPYLFCKSRHLNSFKLLNFKDCHDISYLNSLSHVMSTISLLKLWGTGSSAIATVEARVPQGGFSLIFMFWISMILPNHDGPLWNQGSYSRRISSRTSYLTDPYTHPKRTYWPL